MTLCLGALDVVRLAPTIVEPIIALSIALAAALQMARLRRGALTYPGSPRDDEAAQQTPWVELAICVGFGLVHGLGFAGMLAEFLGSSQGLALPVVSFNVGVELGQLVCVALAFPLLVWVGPLGSRALDHRGYLVCVDRARAGGHGDEGGRGMSDLGAVARVC